MTTTAESARPGWFLPAAIVVASVLSVTASLLGWTVSGSKVRNSYETFRAAQRLGLDELTPFRVVWFLLPVAAVAVLIAVGVRMRRLAGGLLVLQCLITAGAGLVVIAAPLPTAAGPFVALVSSVIGIGVGLVALLGSSS